MQFKEKLYELRKNKNLSQEELAQECNVTRQTVSKWELGETVPDLDKLVVISKYFDISLDELVYGMKSNDSNFKGIIKYLKVFGIILFGLVIIDVLSFIIYFVMNGFPS